MNLNRFNVMVFLLITIQFQLKKENTTIKSFGLLQLADLLKKSTRVLLRCLNAKIKLSTWQE